LELWLKVDYNAKTLLAGVVSYSTKNHKSNHPGCRFLA